MRRDKWVSCSSTALTQQLLTAPWLQTEPSPSPHSAIFCSRWAGQVWGVHMHGCPGVLQSGAPDVHGGDRTRGVSAGLREGLTQWKRSARPLARTEAAGAERSLLLAAARRDFLFAAVFRICGFPYGNAFSLQPPPTSATDFVAVFKTYGAYIKKHKGCYI